MVWGFLCQKVARGQPGQQTQGFGFYKFDLFVHNKNVVFYSLVYNLQHVHSITVHQTLDVATKLCNPKQEIC